MKTDTGVKNYVKDLLHFPIESSYILLKMTGLEWNGEITFFKLGGKNFVNQRKKRCKPYFIAPFHFCNSKIHILFKAILKQMALNLRVLLSSVIYRF